MRIWVFSDLHLQVSDLERHDILPVIPDADLCIVAGDVVSGEIGRSMDWLGRKIRPRMPIIFVAGNHEFYRKSVDETVAAGHLSGAQNGIEFLDDEAVTIAGVRLFGSTMWTDFDVFAHGDGIARGTAMAYAGKMMTDYRLIWSRQSSRTRWTPLMSLQQHMASRMALENELASSTPPTVVVSHHAPHPRSVAPEFAKDLLTPSFVSDLSVLIERYRPSLWVHGHTHTSFDYKVGETRLVCNPLGYRHERTGFDPLKVVEI